jgi:hypothetical protein
MFRIPPGTVPFVKQWYRSTEHIHRSRMGQAQPKFLKKRFNILTL